MSDALQAFQLRGAEAAAALDWLHVHSAPCGAIEGDDEVTVWLAGPLPPLPFHGLQVRELPPAEANRTATGREQDHPIRVADDLLVRPPWVPSPPGFHGIELVVPRGMAFGSGEHESTKAALRAMHAVWQAPASLVDIGTGSGILAVYAAVRGCPRIAACDVEPAAVEAARSLLPAASVVHGGPQALPFAGDCAVANLAAGELHAALDQILAAWTRRDFLLLAGCREHETEALLRRVPAAVVHREAVGAFGAVVFRAGSCPGGSLDQVGCR